MARPTKNNCDYFPHQTTMRNHRKVKALRNKFGQVLGYAFWAMFIEYLTEQDGCEVENSEIELDMFAGELGVSVTEIQEMVNYCIRIELLFLNKDNFIYSESLNDNLLPVFEKRKKAKEMSKTRKRRENGTFIQEKTTALGVTVAETPQSKVEYSKVKKSTSSMSAEAFLSCFHNNCPMLSKIKVLSQKRKDKVNLRIKEMENVETINTMLTKLGQSKFCNGDNDRKWKADLDWLIANDTNWVKVYEGKYDNKTPIIPIEENSFAQNLKTTTKEFKEI